MTEVLTDPSRAQFLADVHSLPANGAPDWLKQIREIGEAQFAITPWPNTRMEQWRHTNITPIVDHTWHRIGGAAPLPTPQDAAPFSFAAAGWAELVFVDGAFAPYLSTALPENVAGGALYPALKGAEGAVIEQHLNQHLRERNAYTALNTAFLHDGAYLRVPRNAVVEQPIHLLFITSAGRGADTAVNLRNLIVLEESAQAKVVASYVSLAGGKAYLNNVVEEIALAPNARLDYYRVVREGAGGNHLATTEIKHARDTHCKTYTFTLDGNIVRNELCTDLAGEGAECNLVGLYLNDGERLLDNALDLAHRVPNCRSRILYKGVLGGKSKAVFAGRVHVHRDAQKTDSDQLSNNLLLSDSATIDAKPQLEIYADDVKCTHGATIGSAPEKIIYYFRTRGIAEDMARAMLTYGFAGEVVNEVELDALRDWLNDYIYKRYSPIA